MENISKEITLIIGASIFFIVVAVGIIMLILVYQKKQLQYLIEKNQMKIHFENEILKSQLEIQEQTLKTISEEIHDNIGQVLSLVKLNLNTIPPIEETEVQTKIDSSRELLSKAISDLRDLSRSLHGDRVAEIGLQAAITNELKIIQNTGQFKTSLQVTGEPYNLDAQKEMILFRIVQEALHNAVKHSNASQFTVLLNYNSGNFVIIVKDNGKGFDVAGMESSPTGIGLKSMQNRAALIGGKFSLISSEHIGTSITVEIASF